MEFALTATYKWAAGRKQLSAFEWPASKQVQASAFRACKGNNLAPPGSGCSDNNWPSRAETRRDEKRRKGANLRREREAAKGSKIEA